MSTATITQYSMKNPDSQGAWAPTLNEPDVASENLTFSTSTANAAPFNYATRFVRIAAIDSALHYSFAATPTATSADPYLPIGGVAVVGVVPGSDLKVALLAV